MRLSRELERGAGERNQTGFTLVELAIVIGLLTLLGVVLFPSLARTSPGTKAAVCARNLSTLAAASRMYADENADGLIASNYGIAGRPPWLAETLEDVFAIVRNGTLFPYTGKSMQVYRCPADPSRITYATGVVPRPRSYSMTHVFGTGAFLDSSYNPSQTAWRTYARAGEMVLPAKTFLFLDEHPQSINDGAFANVCTGAQPGDSPTTAWIIDFPANYHNGGCSFSFADGHVETHLWMGAKLRNAPNDGTIGLSGRAESSWRDVQWLAARTTVRQ